MLPTGNSQAFEKRLREQPLFSPKSSVVRIHSSEGGVVGAGIFCGESLVITCEHVVSAAKNRFQSPQPGLSISVDKQHTWPQLVLMDFPLISPGKMLLGQVHNLYNVGKFNLDVVYIRITSPLPSDKIGSRLAWVISSTIRSAPQSIIDMVTRPSLR